MKITPPCPMWRITYQIDDLVSILIYKPRGRVYVFVTSQRTKRLALLHFTANMDNQHLKNAVKNIQITDITPA